MSRETAAPLRATVRFDDYYAVIPQIQNVYGPEQDAGVWKIGFKYVSGVFEYISYEKKPEAESALARLLKAIDAYWNQEATTFKE